jgi:hypothetical protein
MTNQSAASPCRAFLTPLSISSTRSDDRNLSSRVQTPRRGLAWLRGVVSLAAAVILPGTLCAPAQAQTLVSGWTQQAPATSPSARDNFSLAYDSAQNNVVLFGGFNGSYLSDTWLWNGTSWTQAVPASSPLARDGYAMAYDAAHGQVVLFGGASSASQRLGDTWVWNGTTWTQAAPATSPSARNGAGMVYDAALGEVVLFGGDTGSAFLNDTWVWNGTNWIQQSPANSPPGRAGQAMVYDASLGEIVVFGGEGSSGYLNDTWEWNGTNWTQQSPATSPSARYFPGATYDAAQSAAVIFGGYNGSILDDTWTWSGTNWTQLSPTISPSARFAVGMTYNAALGQIVMFGGGGSSGDDNDTWGLQTPQNFGNVNVCPSGQSTPAPCNNTIALTYSVSGATYFGTPQVVVQGAAGSDFTLASGSTCIPGAPPVGTCTVNVTFAPQAPGLRTGAVNLVDAGGNLLATTLIYGNGQGPEIVYGPTINGSIIRNGPSLESVVSTPGYTLSPRAMTTDAAGDLFVADPATPRVLEIPANGTPSLVGVGLGSPQALALDGAGDLFIADSGNQEVLEVPAGCTTSACQIAVYKPTSADPVGLAVDGIGDLFIVDGAIPGVVEIPAGCTSSSCWISVGSGWSDPSGLAIDAAGDLFVADSGLAQVIEVPPGCTVSSCQTKVGGVWVFPHGVAVDAAGDVYVADSGLGAAGEVVEVPPGCATNACKVVLLSGLSYDVAVDAAGQVYITDATTEQIQKINQAQLPSVSFDTTYVGFTSDDSPQSFTVLNVGNQTLNAIGPGLVVTGPNFIQVAGTGTPADCSATFSLAPGADCNLSTSFTPQIEGLLASTAALTDNNLNGAPATQSIPLSGGALNQVETLNLTGAGTGNGFVEASPTGINCNILGGVASGPTCSSNYIGGEGVSLEEVPSSGFTFAGWGGACASAGTSQFCNINLNVNTATNITASFAAASNYTLQLTEVGNGTGIVADNQSQISCSVASGSDTGTCSGTYSSGTSVTLTANATGTTTFAGWGGACASSGASEFCTVTMNSALNVSASFVAPGTSQAGMLKPITAGVVYGQGGSFTSNAANTGGVSASSLNNPLALALDSGGDLYVVDRSNNRVLFYPRGSTTATRVYGQNGGFTSTSANNGGISANSLSQPWAVAVDSSSNLYVADTSNNRVLFYPAGSTTATQVYGQGGSFTSNAANNGGLSANSLTTPAGVAVDSGGNLYVADGNNRVLFFPSGTTTATRVYGQSGSFTTNTSNNGGVSANSLWNPQGLVLDSGGDLYVADIYNNRVLFYPYNSATATRVYGQNGSFTTNTANDGGVGANSLYQPFGLALDSSGNLYVSGYINSNVLFYPSGSTTATRVYGQGGDFNSATANNGGVSANSLDQPTGVALDSSGNLYVADIYNNRVLEYGPFGNVNVCPSDATTPAPCNSTVTLSYSAAATTNFGATQVVTQGVTGLDFSLGSGSTCTGTVAAGNTCIVNVNFAPLAPGWRMGAAKLFDNNGNLIATAPVYGNGQAPEIAFGPGAQSTVGTGSFPLVNPRGILVDAAGNLFISDVTNQEVLKVSPYGNVSTVGFGFQFPQGLAEDGAGDLFVADNNLNEVVEIPAGCNNINCQVYLGSNLRAQLGVAADGAGDVFFDDFLDGEAVEIPAGCTSTGCQKVVYNPGGGSEPVALTADAAGDLFVADFGLKTVEEVPAGCTTSGCLVSIGTGWQQPDGVAVDAAGDVFVADAGLDEIVEIPAGCTSATCQVVLVSGVDTVAIAVDASGDLVVDDLLNKRIFEVARSQPPSFNFALTNVGSTSPDSPQTVSIQNVGNQPLTGSLALTLGTNFFAGTSSTCGGAFSLPPGASCYDSFSFLPQSTGYLTATAGFSDNTSNLSPLVVLQTVNLIGNGGLNGQPVGVLVPNVVGLTQALATPPITGAGLALGTVSTASSSVVPSGSVIASNPPAGTQVSVGSEVRLLVSSGQPTPPTPNPLSMENNYFVTGDYASAGVTLRGRGIGGTATGTITIPSSTANPGVSQGVPDGADIIDGFLYWETLENTPSPSSTNGTFLGYPITGQQIGSGLDNYTDGTFTGTLRVYRADVNTYFPGGTNGVRYASGSFTVSLPDNGGTGFPLTEGASLVVIYRVLSPNFPLKSVVIYDGSAIPATSTTQNMLGFYDAAGGGESTTLFANSGSWNNSSGSVTVPAQASQYNAPLNAGSAYAAVILSTPVLNSDNDGILDSWKAGPTTDDFYAGQPGYYDAKTGSWVSLPGAKHGEKDLFVQLDYMCGAVLSNGSCDPNQENLFPSPDAQGNDPLAMVTNAFAKDGVVLHLEIGNAVPEDTCTDNLTTTPPQLCQFPSTQALPQPGVIGWKNSLEFSKLWPKNLASCAAGGDCSPRFPYGQKDSYHYVLFGHSLAIPAWNTRYGTLTSIQVINGVTTIVTADRGAGINACPSRITISGVLGNPSLNGVYNTTSCPDTQTIIAATPGVTSWSYPNNTMPEPVLGLTSGTVTSISGYSDLGGADSAVTLGLWETAPNQDMSKRANVIAGTLFHEIGHTLGLSHGGLYYQTPGSYIPTFDVNCKPNYQSSMNYLFQLDGVGPSAAVAYSNQTLETLNEATLGSVTNLTDGYGNPATFPTSAWYTPIAPSAGDSAATMHCDGTPLTGDTGYRVNGTIAPVTPAWSSQQNIGFDGVSYTQMLGYNDVANIDLRQVGATGGEFASLAGTLSFGSSQAPLNIAAGGSASVGAGGTVALGSGGTVTLGSGGNVTLGSGGTITLTSAGNVTLGSGGNVTLGSGATITPGSGGIITLGSGGLVTLGSGGIITMGSGGTVTVGAGPVILGSGGIIALGSGGSVTIPSTGGPYSYTLDGSGGIITLGSGGNVTLGSGVAATLSGTSTIAPSSGGLVTLGSGGLVTLGSGGIITMGSGGIIALGSGGNVTLGSGGIITLGSGGNVTLGSGGNVTLGSGGIVTLGSGGDLSMGAGGNVTLGSGGTVTLGSGGNVTLGSGGNVTLGSGGIIAMGSGGIVTLGSGGIVTLGSGGIITLGSGGVGTVGPGIYTIPAGGSFTAPAGGGTIALGSGGNVTLGSGGIITMGSGGTITLGSGGNVTLGSGGVIALGSGGNVTLGSGGNIALGSGGNITLGSGGASTAELTYQTANSIVRPPSSPTETPSTEGVRVDWTAPAFGVVSTYTIYRSSDGATPIVIGSVSGVNGNPPATEFIDTNPDLTSQTVVYTITTTLLPVAIDPTQRQSAQSPPAVLTNDQSISLGPLPSSVTITNPPTVTATAMSAGIPNGLQVNFSATGSCAIGNQSIANGVSSAAVTLNSTGTCTITATQPGTSPPPTGTPNPPYYNPAGSVSGSFTILSQGSNTTAQTINFPQLQNSQYGNTFSLSASSSAGLPVSFTASGPCTISGTITGVGVCAITASAPANSTYSAASVTQSFTIYPAVLKVTANNAAIPYGQPLPSFTYAITGFVSNESPSVVSGVPALSTTATAASNAGTYPITVSTGTLATANYSFLYVSGTLTIQPVSQSALTLITSSPLTFNQSEALGVTGGSTSGAVTYTLTGGPCTIVGAQLTANSGTGSCTVTATMAGNSNYSSVTSTPANTVTLSQASQAITFTTSPPTSAGYTSSFTVAATGGASSNAVTFTSSGECSNSGATYTMTSGSGTCSVIANQAGNSNYAAAAPVTKTVNGTLATPRVTFTGAPSSATYKSGFTVATTTNSSTTAVITSSGACTNTGAAVTMTSGTGTCSLTATWAADSNYSGATASQSTTATKIAPTVTFTGAPSSAAYKSAFTVATTTNASTTAVITSSGACTNTGTAVTMTSGTGTCSLTATWAADSNYNGTTASQFTAATLVAQAITFTTSPPASAAYNSTFTVAATGGASGNAVTFTSSGACSNSGATYTMTNSTGTCSVIANQAGNTNYSAAPQVTDNVSATGPLVTVSPSSISFGTVNLGSITTKNITLTNIGTAPVTVSDPILSIVKGGNSNEFVAVNLCLTPLAAGKSCTITIAFVAGPYYTPQTATLEIMDNAPGSPQPVTLSATVLVPQTISFTTSPPATAAYKSSFTVAATGGASGNAVTFTSSGVCTNSGAVYTMTSGTGTCSVIANQAGNATYAAAAQVTKTVTAALVPQAITFTTSSPTSAAYKTSFTVAATGGASGNAVTFTSSGACTNSGATYTMTSSTGTCTVIANQAGNTNYAAAAQVTKTSTATPAPQAITFTTSPPTSAAYKTSFTVAATGGASGNAVTFTSSGACTNSGATYTMTSSTGTCSVIASQAGNTNYAAAAQVTKTSTATPAPQAITFTTSPPASEVYKSSFTVAATGGGSGNAVTFTSSGACTNSGATYTITSTSGTCSVIANQAGNSNYAAAAQVTKTVAAT